MKILFILFQQDLEERMKKTVPRITLSVLSYQAALKRCLIIYIFLLSPRSCFLTPFTFVRDPLVARYWRLMPPERDQVSEPTTAPVCHHRPNYTDHRPFTPPACHTRLHIYRAVFWRLFFFCFSFFSLIIVVFDRLVSRRP